MRTRRHSLRRAARWLVPALAAAALAACSSMGNSSMGGAGYPVAGAGPAAVTTQLLVGTLANVDHGNRRLLLAGDDGRQADIAYDASTDAASPAGLKPGDRITVQAVRDGRLWHAQSIQAAPAQDAAPPAGDAGAAAAGAAETAMEGALTAVDAGARTIAFTEGGVTGGQRQVRFDAATRVEFQGRPYPLRDLRAGDMVRLQARRSDRGWIASRIVVQARASDR